MPQRAQHSSQAVEPVPGFGRIPVSNVSPVVEGGHYPAKAVVDEWFPVTANVFREGHDAVNATAVLTAPDGTRREFAMEQQEPMGLDIWQGWVQADAEGDWSLHVEGWSDVWGTVHQNAVAKLHADVDRELVCLELADGRKLAVVQIAGLVARRILCWAKVGQELRTGERFGLIRFGSRLDVYLPAGVTPLVAIGQTMVAGETVIADLSRVGPACPARED